jgi:polysaccharide chain length determinant protein (PEP-CTERM system associated)
MNVHDYTGILRRRRRHLIVPTIVVGLATFLVSLKIPNRFTSQTLVLIEQPQVPTSVVEPVVTAGLDERLASMKEEILSRARLEPVVSQFGLYGNTNLSMDDKIEELQKGIDVKPVEMMAETRANGLPGFHVVVTLNDARLAQLVCNQITSMFTDESILKRQQQAENTSDFVDQTLVQARKKLDDQDAKLAEFKGKHINDMPDEQQSNLNLLMSLNTQLDGVNQALSRAQQEKGFTESQMSQLLNAAMNQQKGELAINPHTLDQQLDKAEQDLTILESRYTDQYPEVIKQKAQIETLKRQIAAGEQDGATTESTKTIGADSSKIASSTGSTTSTKADKTGSSTAAETAADPSVSAAVLQTPQYQALRTQLFTIEQTIREKTKQQDTLLGQIRSYESRVQMSPVVEAEYKSLTRDHEDALAFYNSLLKKHDDSAMATELERRQQGELFRILDPASLPDKPSFPNRPLIIVGGFVGGLAIGVALTLVLESGDKSLRSDLDVAVFLKIPTLALVPMIEGEKPGIPRGSLPLGTQTPKLQAGV